MKSIKEILEAKAGDSAGKKKRGPNCERAAEIEQVMLVMCEHLRQPGESEADRELRINRRFKYWLGRTRRLAPPEIYRIVRAAKDGGKPPALFNFLLKKKLAELPVAVPRHG